MVDKLSEGGIIVPIGMEVSAMKKRTTKLKYILVSAATIGVLSFSGCETVKVSQLSTTEQLKISTMCTNLMSDTLESSVEVKAEPWPTGTFAATIPEPAKGTLTNIEYDETGYLRFILKGIGKKQAMDYVTSLEKSGFTLNQKSSGTDDDLSFLYFIANRENGDRLFMIYTAEMLEINVESKAYQQAQLDNALDEALKSVATITPSVSTNEEQTPVKKEDALAGAIASLPKPEGAVLFSEATTENGYNAIYSNITVEDCRTFAEKVKNSGYATDVKIVDNEVLGIQNYKFEATDEQGKYRLVFSFNNVVMTLSLDIIEDVKENNGK